MASVSPASMSSGPGLSGSVIRTLSRQEDFPTVKDGNDNDGSKSDMLLFDRGSEEDD